MNFSKLIYNFNITNINNILNCFINDETINNKTYLRKRIIYNLDDVDDDNEEKEIIYNHINIINDIKKIAIFLVIVISFYFLIQYIRNKKLNNKLN